MRHHIQTVFTMVFNYLELKGQARKSDFRLNSKVSENIKNNK